MDPRGQLPSYPLRCVPLQAFHELGSIFDTDSVTGITFGILAQIMDRMMGKRLHMTTLLIAKIKETCKNPTVAILEDASKRGATIDVLQRAIIEIGAAAEHILPRYLQEIEANFEAETAQTRPGFPHTCTCQDCAQNMIIQQLGSTHIHNNINGPGIQNNMTRRQPTPCNMAAYQTPHPNDYGQSPCHSRDFNINIPRVPTPYVQQQYPHQRPPKQFPGHMSPSHIESGTSACNFSDNTMVKSSRRNDMNHHQHRVQETIQSPSANQNLPNSAIRCDSTNQARNADGVLKQNLQHEYSHSSQSNSVDWIPPEEIDSSDDDIDTSIVNYRHNKPSEHNGRGALGKHWKENMQPNTGHKSPRSICDTNTPLECTQTVTIYNRKRSNSDGSQSRQNSNSRSRHSGGDEKLNDISNQCTCVQQKPKLPLFPKEDKSKLIFVTFAEHSKRHTSDVLGLCNNLMKEFGCTIKCDMFNELFVQQQINSNEWVDHYFSSARFVLICVSKLYAQFTQPDAEYPGVEPNNNRLHTRYIFDRARSEFITNGSINRRFLPVIFTETGADLRHLPDFLRSTLNFVYPDPKSSLTKFLKQYMETNSAT